MTITTGVDNSGTKLEIYKFIIPILISLVGFLLWLQLNSINDSIRRTNDKVDNLSSTVSTVAAHIEGIENNVSYDRSRIDILERKR